MIRYDAVPNPSRAMTHIDPDPTAAEPSRMAGRSVVLARPTRAVVGTRGREVAAHPAPYHRRPQGVCRMPGVA